MLRSRRASQTAVITAMNENKLVLGEGPPPEAYSRVTNPERFEPLHPAALTHLERLQDRFDVERVEGYGLDPELEQADLTRPSVRLVPAGGKGASITVVFTSFPALSMRCGRWLDLAFPECGCDACAATLDSELERLSETIDDVVSGRFTETIRIPFLFGSAQQEWKLWAPAHQMGGARRIPRSRARTLVSGANREIEWPPWTVRL